MSQDPVPNVRFNVAKSLVVVKPLLDQKYIINIINFYLGILIYAQSILLGHHIAYLYVQCGPAADQVDSRQVERRHRRGRAVLRSRRNRL